MKAKIPSLLVLSAAGILMLSGSAIAQIIAYDPFVIGADPANGEYSAGPIVTQDPTVTGWNLPWFESFPSTSAQIINTGLSYNNGSGAVASTGGAVQSLGNQSLRDARFLSPAYTDATVTTVYMSFMMQLENTNNTYRAFELHQTTSNDGDRKLQIGTGEQGSSDFFVRLFNQNNFGFFADLGPANTDVNFFVAKFVFGDTNDTDSLTLWMNPEDLGNEAGSTPDFFKDTFNMQFNITTFAHFGDGGATWDELRFGNTFQDVTTVPEPRTYAMLMTFGLLFFLQRLRSRRA